MGCHHDWKPSYTQRDFICTKCGATAQQAGYPKRRRSKASRASWVVLGLVITLIAGAAWWAATEGINMVSDAADEAAGIITDTIDGVAPDVEQTVGTVVGTVSDAVEGVIEDPESITDAVIGMLPEAVGPYVLQVDDDASNLPTTQSPEQPTDTVPSDDRPQSPFDRTIWPDPSGAVVETPQTPPGRSTDMLESSAPDTESAFIEQTEDHIHDMTNEERTSRGIRHLANDNHLDDIARSHSQDMADRNYFDHDTPEGRDPTDRGMAAGYNCRKDYGSYYTYGLAENIFTISRAGSNPETLARQMVDSWMTSPGHRQNILDSDYDALGVGIAISRTGAVYATQNFC